VCPSRRTAARSVGNVRLLSGASIAVLLLGERGRLFQETPHFFIGDLRKVFIGMCIPYSRLCGLYMASFQTWPPYMIHDGSLHA